ncbi:MAG: adenylyltransferase/cytidyltransferase family protein, partial [Bacteroidales bacterium]|nr:adenylyltransferase/cytidyltransferase family protein [Bacteroidales bacterium]
MEKKIALFPGSFDPITKGHKSIVERALPMFDKIVVAVGTNTAKNSVFPLEKRIEWIEKTFAQYDTVEVVTFNSLTVD